MSGGDESGFLARWSRLKRAGDQPTPTEAEAVPHSATPPIDEEVEFSIPLPSLDDLKPGDTLTAFMQKGVPEALRNAALRKMWALDPMVRDFRSEALDYAWDWNTPGGVPGAGPLSPEDRVADMVKSLLPEKDQTEQAAADTPQGHTDQHLTAAPAVAENPPPPPEEKADETERAIPEREAQPQKRHGGAMPQPKSLG